MKPKRPVTRAPAKKSKTAVKEEETQEQTLTNGVVDTNVKEEVKRLKYKEELQDAELLKSKSRIHVQIVNNQGYVNDNIY